MTAVPIGAVRGWLSGLDRGARETLSSVWLLGLLLLLWQWQATASPSLFVPPVSDALQTLRTEWFSGPASRLFLSETFRDNAFASLARATQGWLVAAMVGVSLGVVLGVWRAAWEFANPLVRFGMSIPSTVLLPIAVVLFGITSSMNVFLIAFGSMWVVLVNTMDGVRSIDETAMLTARSLRLSRFRAFTRVLVPAASPQIVTGLRVSIGIALILMVVSELFAATEGIGYYIVYHQRTFQYRKVWGAVFLLAFLGVLLNGLFALFEAWTLRWHLARGRGE